MGNVTQGLVWTKVLYHNPVLNIYKSWEPLKLEETFLGPVGVNTLTTT